MQSFQTGLFYLVIHIEVNRIPFLGLLVFVLFLTLNNIPFGIIFCHRAEQSACQRGRHTRHGVEKRLND